MIHRTLIARVALALGLVAGLSMAKDTAKQTKKKPSIKQVMQKAFKGGLLKKVLEGKSNQQDRTQLAKYIQAMSDTKPPRGKADSWKTLVAAAIQAADTVAKDASAKNIAVLKKATTCGACHKVHKPTKKPANKKETAAVLKSKMKSLDGKEVDLAKYSGKVLLVVNVASQCGATPQYAGIQRLHEAYAKQGLAVLGVPCNQFGAQEPGSAEEIKQFCSANYGVTFDMLAKVDVNGDKACDLYKHLTSKENSKFGGDIGWNFEKFLVDRKGQIVGRFNTGVEPDAPELVEAIEAALKSK